jgi:poly-beta-1,6-N-acetyl-D-glucosamine synthase
MFSKEIPLPQPQPDVTPPSAPRAAPPPSRAYLLVTPCRDEAAYMRRTLDSVVAQTLRPLRWIIVDDGSTDDTPAILADYAARHDWIEVVRKPDRGGRAVGPGVVEAFNYGLARAGGLPYAYLCKLDLDLDLPPRYFETLVARMEADPRLGSCSGKPWFRSAAGRWVSEKCGDEMSVGMTKFYRRGCFEQIGGFVPQVMWDAIDCHKARQMGWVVASWDGPDLRFEHLRPMGTSQTNVWAGRRRHGFGQYFMGSDPVYFTMTALYRMLHPPYVLGGLATLQGYLSAWWRGVPRYEDADLRAFIRAYQRRALRVGKHRAVAEIEAARAGMLAPALAGAAE